MGDADAEPPTCWLCGRPFGTRIQHHHTVPKSKKGRATVPVHPICHKTIHTHFTNAELARFGEDRARLLENEAVAKFVAWVASKPPDFHARVRVKR
ncbi:MAG: HNH endonuclease [Pontixanthobacter sp.]